MAGCGLRLAVRTSTIALIVTAVTLSTVSRIPAQAGPPYVTDDPEPAAYQSWELNIGPQYAHDGVSITGTSPNADINYGLLPNVQVTFAIPLSFARTSSVEYLGVGDTELGVKYRFVQETRSWPQIAFYPSVSVPSGNSVDGLGAGSLQTVLPLWAQKTIGAYTIYGGSAAHFNPGSGNKTWWFTGAVLNRALTHDLSVGAEVYHTTSATWDGRDSTGFNVGITRDLNGRHSVLFSAGRTFGNANVFSAFAAYQIRVLPVTEPAAHMQ